MSSASQSVFLEFAGRTENVNYELSGLSETNSEGFAVEIQITSQSASAIGMCVFERCFTVLLLNAKINYTLGSKDIPRVY